MPPAAEAASAADERGADRRPFGATSILGMSHEDVLRTVREHLPIRNAEKDARGEVFTPPELVDAMLDALPSEVWRRADAKWLDPASGVGNFPMLVFGRLDCGLAATMPDAATRRKHILTRMLYMVELDAANVAVARRIFGPDANIHCGCFLDGGWREAFGGVDTFDVVVGNPPYSKPRGGSRRGAAQGGNDLYPAFVLRAVGRHLAADTGLAALVHPPKWRAPDKRGDVRELGALLASRQLLVLRILGAAETQRLFRVAASVDWYVLHNRPATEPTLVEDEAGARHRVHLRDQPFVPNSAFDDVCRLLDPQAKTEVLYSRSTYGTDKVARVRDAQRGAFVHPVLHSIKQNGDKVVYYANERVDALFVPKVIVTKGRYAHAHNDHEGAYGLSNYSFGLPIASRQEGERIVEALRSPFMRRVLAATKWSSGFTDHGMFRHFRDDWARVALDDTPPAAPCR